MLQLRSEQIKPAVPAAAVAAVFASLFLLCAAGKPSSSVPDALGGGQSCCCTQTPGFYCFCCLERLWLCDAGSTVLGEWAGWSANA